MLINYKFCVYLIVIDINYWEVLIKLVSCFVGCWRSESLASSGRSRESSQFREEEPHDIHVVCEAPLEVEPILVIAPVEEESEPEMDPEDLEEDEPVEDSDGAP